MIAKKKEITERYLIKIQTNDIKVLVNLDPPNSYLGTKLLLKLPRLHFTTLTYLTPMKLDLFFNLDNDKKQ